MKGCYKQWAFTLVGLCIVFCFSAALTATASAAQYYVNPGESIQAAVDNASDGDMIIVRDGTYVEKIDVEKRLTFRSENGSATVQAANTSDSVFEVTADYVNISGFTVENSNSSAGISLNEVEHCNISYNNASNNIWGIFFENSSNNTIMNNIASNNVYGIYLNNSSSNNVVIDNTANSNFGGGFAIEASSDYNKISNNNASFNTFGIYLHSSNYNTITSNYATSNNITGILLGVLSNNNTVMNNTAANNALSGISLYSSNKNVIEENTISNNSCGIFLSSSSSNNAIINNTASSNLRNGICLKSSLNNTIKNNIANSNNETGIFLFDSSTNNTIINNTVSSNFWDGVDIAHSRDNIIRNNNASFNEGGGIMLYSSNYNTITGNYASSNNGDGIIILNLCNNNSISNNNASFNKAWGISVYSSDCNTIAANYACSNKGSGISIGDFSSNNTVINNTVNSNFLDGIDLYSSSDHNTIRNNNASFNGDWGISLLSSDYNQIKDNNLNFNKYCGILLWDIQHFNIITNNNASNNTLFGIFVCNSTNQVISNNLANKNDRGIGLHESRDIKAINNTASTNKISGFSLINSTGNTIINNSASFNTYEGIYLSNSNRNTIANNNVSSNYFGISLYSSNGNNITDNSAESNYYSEVIMHSSSGTEIVNNTYYIQDEIVYGISLHIIEAITPSLQTVEKGTNASYNIIAENLGNSPDTFDLVLSSAYPPKISSLDTDTVFLGAGGMSINATISEVEIPQIELKQVKPSIKTITLNVSDTKAGIYTVKVEIISRHDNTVKDIIVTRTIVPGQIASELINSPRITKSAIIKSSINNSVIDTSAIINSSISDSIIKCSVITSSDIVSTVLDDVIVEDADVTNGNILSGNITINEVEYEISTKTNISELIIGSDRRNSDLVGIKNRTLELNTENSNTRFNISAESDYFAASMCVQKSSVPPNGIPEFSNNVGGYVYANASANLVNSTGWLNISVFYDQTALGARDESTLKLRYFNESACSWRDLPVSGINLTGNYVWCNISHYSVFALLAQPAAARYDDSSDLYASSSGARHLPEVVIIPIANPGLNSFNFEWLDLDILYVSTNLKKMAFNARVALNAVEKPVEITDPQGIVYCYFEILTNLESENVKSASIYFRVSKSWIDDNEIATINMHRYNGDWKELKTEKEKENKKYFYYTAETPELSFFVITGEKKAEVFTPPTTTPTPTVLPTTSPVPSAIPTATPVPTAIPAAHVMMSRLELLIVAVIVASAIIVSVALLRGRKKKLP